MRWWDVKDLNLRPKDSDLRDFRHSLDFAFIVAFALDGCRQVSTPSGRFLTKLGSAFSYALLHLGFAEFDTIHAQGFPPGCTTTAMSPLL